MNSARLRHAGGKPSYICSVLVSIFNQTCCSMPLYGQVLTCKRLATTSKGKETVAPRTQDAMPAAAATPTPASSLFAARMCALVSRSKHPTMHGSNRRDEHCIGQAFGVSSNDPWQRTRCEIRCSRCCRHHERSSLRTMWLHAACFKCSQAALP